MDKIQEDIIAEFSIFDDWMDKYNYLIELSPELPLIAPEHKSDQYLIQGCQSRVWIDGELRDGKLYFTADSDAIIAKGIASLLVKVLGGKTPQEVIDTELYFIDKIGLRENLSPTRANGLVAMIRQMRNFAIAFVNR
ncbi:Sulfur acceptor protein SufE for iron-sulfur cluster assembly [Mucinivorans hirudinis]|uniref:Sulfur acceptor protein SufE for iron-sulfur cluster assembly n=1 Tax=Mucinivorans hirudinis TaxID=1433126 RepID=A0A060R977_9BACT|nr:Sulfur acceptor protein SufE for iron-sulfur cluster assembly [Mucinivorans hirudinis]